MKPEEITFPNGNRARSIPAKPDANPSELLNALGLAEPRALIMIAGGADEMDEALKSQLARLFGEGIARAAIEVGALIIDGGKRSGVMALMGEGVAGLGRRSPLLGVSPKGLVSYPGAHDDDGGDEESRTPLDPNHSHFVLVETDEWGGETATMYKLAEELGRSVPALTVLVNGGRITRDEVLRSVQQRWPVFVLEGSGRLADEIARLWKEKPTTEDDAELKEIVNDGDIRLFQTSSPPEELQRLIVAALRRIS
jgi:hypothetical protein